MSHAHTLMKFAPGDEELRREVELLLESDRKAQGQIGSAVGIAAAAFAVQMQRAYSASQIGQRIGPYEIVREIGRAVWDLFTRPSVSTTSTSGRSRSSSSRKARTAKRP